MSVRGTSETGWIARKRTDNAISEAHRKVDDERVQALDEVCPDRASLACVVALRLVALIEYADETKGAQCSPHWPIGLSLH